MITLKICGGWVGSLQVEEGSRLADVRTQLCQLSGIPTDRQKLLLSGKLLSPKDDAMLLCDLQVRNDARLILLDNNPAHRDNILRQEECHHARIRGDEKARRLIALADKLASRRDSGASASYNQYYTEIELQNGTKLAIPESDRQALTKALVLCGKAKELMNQLSMSDDTGAIVEHTGAACQSQLPPSDCASSSRTSPSPTTCDNTGGSACDNTGGSACDNTGGSACDEEVSEVAIQVMLAADELFSSVNPKYSDLYDNDAYMYLDLAWILFKRQQLDRLPMAESCLRMAETKFHKAHGANFERVKQVRQGVAPEKALTVRLHFLQGVVAFLRQQPDEAYDFFIKSRRICWDFQVSDDLLAHLVGMGFDSVEARRALLAVATNSEARTRAAKLESSVNLISEARRQKEEAQLRARQTTQNMDLQKALGKCVDGSWVSIEKFKTLTECMGHRRSDAIQQLRETNNDAERCMLELSRISSEREEITRSACEEVMLFCRTNGNRELLPPSSLSSSLPPPVGQAMTQLLRLGFDNEFVRRAVSADLEGDSGHLAIQMLSNPLILALGPPHSTFLKDQSTPEGVTSSTTTVNFDTGMPSIAGAANTKTTTTTTTTTTTFGDALVNSLATIGRLDVSPLTTTTTTNDETDENSVCDPSTCSFVDLVKLRMRCHPSTASTRHTDTEVTSEDAEIQEELAGALRAEQEDPNSYFDIDLEQEANLIDEWLCRVEPLVNSEKVRQFENERRLRHFNQDKETSTTLKL